jgi:hypothetical protein
LLEARAFRRARRELAGAQTIGDRGDLKIANLEAVESRLRLREGRHCRAGQRDRRSSAENIAARDGRYANSPFAETERAARFRTARKTEKLDC